MPTTSPHLAIRVVRDTFLPTATLGIVYLDLPGDGHGFLPFGYSVEDVDRHVEEGPTPSARKVKGATAIPVGVYSVRLYDSPKHGPQTPELIGVPGFQHIQIHSGNDSTDTEGCLLFGLSRDAAKGTVGRSRVACSWLRQQIIDVIEDGGTVTVEVARG